MSRSDNKSGRVAICNIGELLRIYQISAYFWHLNFRDLFLSQKSKNNSSKIINASIDRNPGSSKDVIGTVDNVTSPHNEQKHQKETVVVPRGQIKLTEDELDREEDIIYEEEYTTEDTITRYYNVRKDKMCKERHTFITLLDLSPSIVYTHEECPEDEQFEIVPRYTRKYHKQAPKNSLKEENLTEEAKEGADEAEEKRNSDDEMGEEEEEETEEETTSSDSSLEVARGDTSLESEDLLGEEEENISLPEDLWEPQKFIPDDENQEYEGSGDGMEVITREDVYEAEAELEDMGSQVSWTSFHSFKKKKTLFNTCEDVTQMKKPLKDLETVAVQTYLPQIVHRSGKFCMALAYDAYVAFEKKVKNAEEKVMKYMEKIEKEFEETEQKEKQRMDEEDEGDKDDYKEKKNESVNSDSDGDDEYLVDDESSGTEEINVDSGEPDLGSSSSSEEYEIEEPGIENQAEDSEEEKTKQEVVKNKKHNESEEDIDGYDLLDEDFDWDFFKSDSEKDMKKETIRENEEIVKESSKRQRDNKSDIEESKIIKLKISEKQQILNHLLNPFEYEPVTLGKDDERDVNFDGPDSEDDEMDDGEYLMALYSTEARDQKKCSMSTIGTKDVKPIAEQRNKQDDPQDLQEEKEEVKNTKKLSVEEREAMKELQNIKRLKELLELHAYNKNVKKRGGVIIEKKYKRMRRITVVLKRKINRLLSEKKKVIGTEGKLRQIRLKRKLKLKREIRLPARFTTKKSKKKKPRTQVKLQENKLPRQRPITLANNVNKVDKEKLDQYSEELFRLMIVTRLVHQKQYFQVGYDFATFEDYDDEKKLLFPLKKMPAMGGAKFRISHMSWAHHLKDKMVISYESSDTSGMGPTHGFVVCYHPMANTEAYDHVYRFMAGVRHFDISFEWVNNGLMLVGLADGSVHMVKIPFPDVIYKTNATTKHTSPIVQVFWTSDWSGKEKLDKKGKPKANMAYNTFCSYAVDGELKFWWVRPHTGFTVYKRIHLGEVSIPRRRYTRITCIAYDHHGRTQLYMGSEDGLIHKYDVRHPPNTFICKFKAHTGPVLDIAVNYYNKDVFLSGGHDGLVKLWRNNRLQPECVYLIQNPVTCITWSHFRSYIWAVVTRDNMVWIYNLERRFSSPMTEQNVLRHSSCLKVAFHHSKPILIICDNRCNIFSYKIPRSIIEPEEIEKEMSWDKEKSQVHDDDEKHPFKKQRKRLEKLLDRNNIIKKLCTGIK